MDTIELALQRPTERERQKHEIVLLSSYNEYLLKSHRDLQRRVEFLEGKVKELEDVKSVLNVTANNVNTISEYLKDFEDHRRRVDTIVERLNSESEATSTSYQAK